MAVPTLTAGTLYIDRDRDVANGTVVIRDFDLGPHLIGSAGVDRYGLVVHLAQFNVEGFLPARTIGERPQLKGPTLTLRAGKRSFSFTEGYSIQVEITEVDFIKLQIELRLKA